MAISYINNQSSLIAIATGTLLFFPCATYAYIPYSGASLGYLIVIIPTLLATLSIGLSFAFKMMKSISRDMANENYSPLVLNIIMPINFIFSLSIGAFIGLISFIGISFLQFILFSLIGFTL